MAKQNSLEKATKKLQDKNIAFQNVIENNFDNDFFETKKKMAYSGGNSSKSFSTYSKEELVKIQNVCLRIEKKNLMH